MTKTQNNTKIGEQTAKEMLAIRQFSGCLGTSLLIVVLIVALLIWLLK